MKKIKNALLGGSFVAAALMALIGVAIFGVRIYHVNKNPLEYGIVEVEGYEYGIALCGEGDGDTGVVTQKGEYHMWSAHNALFMVDYGHMDDMEVNILVGLAITNCKEEK